MKRLLLPLLALALCQPAAAATTRLDRHGTVVLDGRKVFPIVLAKGPPAGTATLAEVAAAGVNVLKVGPAGGWTADDLARTIAENRAAAAHGLYDLGEPRARSRQLRPGRVGGAALLRKVDRNARGRSVRERDRAVEGRRRAVALPDAAGRRFASRTAWRPRGDRAGARASAGGLGSPLGHRPGPARGRPAAGARTSEVTDVHGVNSYPIALGDPDPDLRRARVVDEHPRPGPRRGGRCGRRSGSAGRGATTRPATSSCRRGEQQRFMVYTRS